jgi:predicted alpha/beta-fold hydrolase
VKTLGAGQAGTVVSWDVTQTVQDWYAGTNPNHGLMLIGPSGGGGMLATFAAKESATANRRPRLIIEYLETPPG